MSVHEGHRQRLKERFLSGGLEDFADHTILELILFYANPRSDTNVIAHELINAFGDISAVMDAPIEALIRLPGISYHAAVLIKLFPQVGRRYQICRSCKDNIVDSSKKAGEYIRPYYIGERDEVVYAMFLDNKARLINCEAVSRGSLTNASINVRKISERALINNAAAVILVHNHVSGLPLPSDSDISVTERVKKALDGVEVILQDHIIVAEDDFVSLKESGFFR